MRSLKDFVFFTAFTAILITLIFGGKAIFSYLSCFIENDKDARLMELESENDKLLFELERIETGNIVFKNFDVISAPVHSQYPFSDRNKIIIAAGTAEGVKTGMPVFTPEEFFLGKVLATKKHFSEVKTIFDSSWSSSVAIGESGVEAVAKGGADPVLKLIPEDAEVLIGDFVYNTSPDFPMGALLGRINRIFYERGDIWQLAEIDVPYDASKLRQVKIYLDFP